MLIVAKNDYIHSYHTRATLVHFRLHLGAIYSQVVCSGKATTELLEKIQQLSRKLTPSVVSRRYNEEECEIYSDMEEQCGL